MTEQERVRREPSLVRVFHLMGLQWLNLPIFFASCPLLRSSSWQYKNVALPTAAQSTWGGKNCLEAGRETSPEYRHHPRSMVLSGGGDLLLAIFFGLGQLMSMASSRRCTLLRGDGSVCGEHVRHS